MQKEIRRRSFRAFLCLVLIGSLTLPSLGQNKVIVDNSDWNVISTEHFHIHYTAKSEPLVPFAAQYLEEAYRIVTARLAMPIPKKIPFFLFATHNRFEENNIADVDEGTGGVTEAFKNRLSVYNDGSLFWLKHVIFHEFVHVVQFETLYGGFWKSVRLLKSPFYPMWFTEGQAEYETEELDRGTEDLYLRDAAASQRLYPLSALHGFSHMRPHEVTLAYKQGAAAVRFLDQEYGGENSRLLLKLMKEDIGLTSLVMELTRQDFAVFEKRYLEYLSDYYACQTEGLEEPEAYGRRLTPSDILPVFNTSPAISPDGRFLAYLTDRHGTRELVLYDFQEQSHRILAGREWRKLENIQAEGRAISFSPDGRTLAFVGEKRQRDFLYLYDIKRDRLRQVRTPFEQIRSPAFHPALPRLAVVGMSRGFNDLYEISTEGGVLRRLTNSLTDESDPMYSPDGRTLIFSEEAVAPELHEHGPERNLAALSLTERSADPVPLTDMPGSETAPVFTPDGRSIVFVAGPSSISNLYRLDPANGRSPAALLAGAVGRVTQLTRVIGGNFTPVLSPRDPSRMVFVSFRKTSQNIYLANPSLMDPSVSLAELPAQPSSRNWSTLDPTATEENTAPPTEPVIAQRPTAPARSAAGERPTAPADPLHRVPGTAAGRDLFTGDPREYRFHASTDLFFPLLFYSTEGGLFVGGFWQWSDYLGNHGLQTTTEYASGDDSLDYQIQYQYKAFRPQFFLTSQGQQFYLDFERTARTREYTHALTVSYPFDRFHRLDGTVGTVFRKETYGLFPEFNQEERENLFAASLTRETVIGRYLAVTSGNRSQYTYRAARPVFGGDLSYQTHVFELHQFTPTGREGTVAVRWLSGLSEGRNPQSFRLGGSDRLRGYSRFGAANEASRFTIANLEWRPLLTYINYNGWFLFPDVSLKALYGALFTDIGYGWARSE
ncbi:MAG: PD40 domain-containing protein, partial [Elusimicrobia bacterium]|nr:PD40 domain-containing protein [Elusimicrobiota bacterium]